MEDGPCTDARNSGTAAAIAYACLEGHIAVSNAGRPLVPAVVARHHERMTQSQTALTLPIIDLSALREGSAGRSRLAHQLDAACRRFGFFYLVGHGVSQELVASLMASSRSFFNGPA